MESKRTKRSLRVALVLGAALAGTALVGFGGLAAWQAYTQNNGSQVSAATLSHSNTVGTTVCNSTNDQSSAGALNCGVILNATADSSSWGGTTGTVTIANTGEASSTFELSSPPGDPPSGALCADLQLVISDSNATYLTANPISTTTGISATALDDSTGSANWAGSGASSNTFTFSVTANASFATDNSAPGESCSFDVLFTQSA